MLCIGFHKTSPAPVPHLHSFQHVPEHGPLLPPVILGTVFFAVGGQGTQFAAQQLAVIKVKVLGWVLQVTIKKHDHHHSILLLKSNKIETCHVNLSGELEQQRDGLPGRNAHVNVLALQQPWQLGQMSKTKRQI